MDSDINLSWLRNLIQGDQASQRAIELFTLTTDRELALKAAYKALGLDPRDAPVFGWDLKQGAQRAMAETTPTQPVAQPAATPTTQPAAQPAQTNPIQPAIPAGPPGWARALLLVAASLTGAGAGAGLTSLLRPAAAPTAATAPAPPQGQEWRIDFSYDGKELKPSAVTPATATEPAGQPRR